MAESGHADREGDGQGRVWENEVGGVGGGERKGFMLPDIRYSPSTFFPLSWNHYAVFISQNDTT